MQSPQSSENNDFVNFGSPQMRESDSSNLAEKPDFNNLGEVQLEEVIEIQPYFEEEEMSTKKIDQ